MTNSKIYKSKISYSRYATLITAILFGVLYVGCIATIKEEPAFFSLLAIYLVLIVFAFFYGAAYIKADSNYIVLGSILRGKKYRCAMWNVFVESLCVIAHVEHKKES